MNGNRYLGAEISFTTAFKLSAMIALGALIIGFAAGYFFN